MTPGNDRGEGAASPSTTRQNVSIQSQKTRSSKAEVAEPTIDPSHISGERNLEAIPIAQGGMELPRQGSRDRERERDAGWKGSYRTQNTGSTASESGEGGTIESGMPAGKKRRTPRQQEQNKLAQHRYRLKRKAEFEALQRKVIELNNSMEALRSENQAHQRRERQLLSLMVNQTGSLTDPRLVSGLMDDSYRRQDPLTSQHMFRIGSHNVVPTSSHFAGNPSQLRTVGIHGLPPSFSRMPPRELHPNVSSFPAIPASQHAMGSRLPPANAFLRVSQYGGNQDWPSTYNKTSFEAVEIRPNLPSSSSNLQTSHISSRPQYKPNLTTVEQGTSASHEKPSNIFMGAYQVEAMHDGPSNTVGADELKDAPSLVILRKRLQTFGAYVESLYSKCSIAHADDNKIQQQRSLERLTGVGASSASSMSDRPSGTSGATSYYALGAEDEAAALQLVEISLELSRAILNLPYDIIGEVMQNGSASEVPPVSENQEFWNLIVAKLQLSDEQAEWIRHWKDCFLKSLDGIYDARVLHKNSMLEIIEWPQDVSSNPILQNLFTDDAAVGELGQRTHGTDQEKHGSSSTAGLTTIQGQNKELSSCSIEQFVLQMAKSYGYYFPAEAAARLTTQLEKLRNNVAEERELVLDGIDSLLKKVLTAKQALVYLKASHPFFWNVLGFSHAVGKSYSQT